MKKRFKILRSIREVFEVDASSFDEACQMIGDGELDDSVPLDDDYELVEEEEIPDVP